MKKKISLVITALIVSALLAGCNQPIDNPEYTIADNGGQIISESTAKRAAAEKASLTIDDVRYTSVILDASSGSNKYDVSFLHDGYEYTVEVDAENGAVDSFQREEVTGVITEEEALLAAIAVTELGEITKDELTKCKIELDKEGNSFEYEIEFIYDGVEYEITLNAVDGAVKGYEVDDNEIIDDDNDHHNDDNDDRDGYHNNDKKGETAPEVNPDDTSDITTEDNSDNVTGTTVEVPEMPEVIGEDAALSAAIAKAELGEVTADALDRCKIELDKDDGKLEYEIKFSYNSARYEVTVDALTGEILDYEADVPTDPDNLITQESALSIVLEHAGLTEDDITDLHITIDEDHGKVEYEIEFISGYDEYDYDIDAVSGEILNFDKEAERFDAPEQSMPEIDTLTGEDAALASAYAHAEVNEADVYDVEIELDNDHHGYVYEIEFKCGDAEYEYDIDAVSGEVIRGDCEIDD